MHLNCAQLQFWLLPRLLGVLGGMILLGLGLLAAPSRSTLNAADETSASAQPQGQVIVEPSMHEFMEYVYEPTFQRLKANMAQVASDTIPWKAIKADGLILAESANLLLMRGPDKEREAWASHAIATRDKGSELYQAARAKDAQKANAAYTAMLTHCNACHDEFAKGKHQLKP